MFKSLFSKRLQWHIVPEYQGTKVAEQLKDFNAVYNFKGQYIEGKIFKITLDNKNFYLKKYARFKRVLPRFISFSKVKMEWKNLLWFKKIGIPAAPLVAYGEERKGIVVQRGILITEELSNCFDLVHIADNMPERLKQKKWLSQISHQLAEITRKLHAHHFAHNDLKWRNIMVDIKSDYPYIYLIDCPAGMKWIRPFLAYRIIKDLACLDKRAKYELSRTQRLAFYKDYAQCKKLNRQHKKQIRKVLQFFHERE